MPQNKVMASLKENQAQNSEAKLKASANYQLESIHSHPNNQIPIIQDLSKDITNSIFHSASKMDEESDSKSDQSQKSEYEIGQFNDQESP